MPMKVAVLADVHADLEALRDALAQIDKLGCDLIVCAGDLVGYGLFPEEVIALIRERGVICVRGNHDRWALGDGTAEEPDGGDQPHDASGWDLSSDARRFLRELPRVWRKEIDGIRIVVVHGSVHSEMDGVIPDTITGQQLRQRLDEAEADVLIVGHNHEPFRLPVPGRGIVVNPGALLRMPDEQQTVLVFDPRQGRFADAPRSAGGTFGIFEIPSCKFTVRSAKDGRVVRLGR
jgi:putative phosphoesterase